MTSRETILPSLELAARLNKEIGQGFGDASGAGVAIAIVTNVDPGTSRGRGRALPMED